MKERIMNHVAELVTGTLARMRAAQTTTILEGLDGLVSAEHHIVIARDIHGVTHVRYRGRAIRGSSVRDVLAQLVASAIEG